MKRLSSKQLKFFRNIIIAVGFVGSLVIWYFLPDIIVNTRLLHIGNGKEVPKIGMLIVPLTLLFSLGAGIDKEEIHTDDPMERAKLIEDREKKTAEVQVCSALFLTLVTWCIMSLGFVFGR